MLQDRLIINVLMGPFDNKHFKLVIPADPTKHSLNFSKHFLSCFGVCKWNLPNCLQASPCWVQDILMERGSYSRLNRIDEIQIELAEQPLCSPTHESFQTGIAKANQIDYVLVYESERDICELNEESLRERRKRAGWRCTFERCLENRFGLVLQRKMAIIDEVGYSLFFCFNFCQG